MISQLFKVQNKVWTCNVHTHPESTFIHFLSYPLATGMCVVMGTGYPKTKDMEAPCPTEFCTSQVLQKTRSHVGMSVCMYGQKQISHTTMESPKSPVQLSRVQIWERLDVSHCVPQVIRTENVCSQGNFVFFVNPSTGWARPLGVKWPVCFTKSLFYNVLNSTCGHYLVRKERTKEDKKEPKEGKDRRRGKMALSSGFPSLYTSNPLPKGALTPIQSAKAQ